MMKRVTKMKIALVALISVTYFLPTIIRTASSQSSITLSATSTRALANASNDDHATKESAHESLFGALDNIEPNRFILSLLIVISAVLCVEYIFHLLHLFTEDSPFHKVVQALEKELMIVGCTAFIFKISINVTHFLSEEWFFALEFSDLLVPFFSFTNCIISLFLILTSLLQCDTWCRAFHLRIEEILDYAIDETGVSILSKWWAPFSTVVAEMEFRIFHDIFCDNYGIRREAFAFDEYVQLVYEKYVLRISQLRVASWMVFVALLLFVLTSRAMEVTLGPCDSKEDLHCYHLREAKIFVIFGTALCVLSSICASFCRYYEIQFITRHGIANLQDYPQFLLSVESKGKVGNDKKMFNEEELKRVIQEMKAASGHGNAVHHHQPKQFQALIRRMGLYFRSVLNIRASSKIHSMNSFDEEYSNMMKEKFKPAPALESDLSFALDRNDSKREDDSLKHKAEHLDELFLFTQPDLFFGCIQFMILPIALYFAMWIVNFSSIHISSGWKFLAVTPGIFSLVMFVYMVRTAALLKAVYIVDKDAMLEVIEQTEGSRQLGETIREKLLQRITFMGEPYVELKKLFGDIDKDGSSKLSRLEFEGLMDRLDINFSRKKWKQIYHEIDRNYDDQVSFDEFILFLFPDNDVSTAMERKRMKVIKSRLEKKSKLNNDRREKPYEVPNNEENP